MGKAVGKALGFAGKIVGVAAIGIAIATGVGAMGAAGILGLSATTAGAIAAGLTLGGSLLSPTPRAPRASPAAADRLFASIDPRAPRKIVFGRTAMATDIRDQEYTGDQEYLHRFIVVASHKVAAVEELWFDDKRVWTAAAGVEGEAAGYLTVTPILEGSAANAINISARMGSTRRYTGLAYLHLRYKLTGNGKKAESPFAQNIPSRVTIRGKGALVYDPRLDSTVPGGSGAMRAGDQSTWAWSDSASRNPALQELWYELGWRIQNPATGEWKLAVGKGVPPARLDLASFITAANACDESVALAAGGTEPRYRSDGVFSEADGPQLVRDNLKAAMNATLDDVDGRVRLTVLVNDLASPIAAFTANDIVGRARWMQTPPLSDTFNVIRGSHTDPSDQSLYQQIDYPEVALASVDGIARVETIDFPLVQSPSQAQRLAKQRLQRMQYPGTFSAVFQATAWKVQKGDVVTITFPALGWYNKLFRVLDLTVQVDGTVPMVLREEHSSIYAWSASEVAAVTAAAPTTYNSALNPVRLGIGDAGLTSTWSGVDNDNGLRPSDGATSDLALTLIGTTAYGSYAGNTLTKTAGTGAWDFGVVGLPRKGAQVASTLMCSAATYYCTVALDLSATTVGPGATYHAQVSSAGDCYLFSNGVQLKSIGIGAVPEGVLVELAADRRNVHIKIRGKTVISVPATGLDQLLYPKWALYSPGTLRGLRSADYTDAAGAQPLTPLYTGNVPILAIEGDRLQSLYGAGAYAVAVVGTKQFGPCYVECAICVDGDWTMLSLDDDNTASAYELQRFMLQFQRSTGNWYLIGNNVGNVIASGSVAANTIGTAKLATDDVKLRLWLGDAGEVTLPNIPATATFFYPKVWAYSALSSVLNIKYGAFPRFATRNDEGGNMIAAPLDPNAWTYYSGAVQSSTVPLAGSYKSAQLFTTAANVRFGQYPVRGGDDYVFNLAARSDFNGSDTLNISYVWWNEAGAIAAVNLSAQTQTTLTEANSAEGVRQQVRFTVPDAAVRIEAYAERPTFNGSGSFFVNSPFLRKAIDNLEQSTNIQLGIGSTVSALATATDQGGGTGVTITVPTHVRYLPGQKKKRAVTFQGATWTNRPYETRYFIYALDSGLAGGAVAWQITTDPNDALVQSAVHGFTVATPAAGAPATTGSGGAGNSTPPTQGGSFGSGGPGPVDTYLP